MTKTLDQLRTTGFRELKPGRIHLRCPGCGRKQSNTHRVEGDPTRAVLVEILCGGCGMGCFPEPAYLDADGKPVDWEEN